MTNRPEIKRVRLLDEPGRHRRRWLFGVALTDPNVDFASVQGGAA